MITESVAGFPANIQLYLNEIAERLWSNHAAIMIGAGFSKNADKATADAPAFPSWHELGDMFFRKLNNKAPDADTPHYLSPLKLADEVQAAFGRPALDQLLRTHIPNNHYEPSALHVRLLELPWVDVFTVNYDTLLERACVKVPYRRFDFVVNKKDLVYSSRPRIIKLHGSLPSERPFVISEEDYRRYPKEVAPFVNTVQQSLLENTFCMLGFSGDDPNFLQWIGWVRDNLGNDDSPKMYLVLVSSLSDAQRKLLERRNIVVIELSQGGDTEEERKAALSAFLEYLHAKRPPPPGDWPSKVVSPTSPSRTDVEQLIEDWKHQREAYPGWVVAPKEIRSSLWLETEMKREALRFIESPNSITSQLDIALLYEFNWRIERVLRPIPEDMVPYYDRILSRYSPFVSALTVEADDSFHEQSHLEGNEQRHLALTCIDLYLSLLRHYREQGAFEKWQDTFEILKHANNIMKPEQIARFHYERSLNALFSFDISKLKTELTNWITNPALPFWEAKRGGLLAEIGELVDAERVIEKALASIRVNLQLTPIVEDLTWVSQECHVMFLLSTIKRARLFAQHIWNIEDDQQQRFTERWNDLKKYSCDPWLDLALFEIELKASPVRPKNVSHKEQYDLGRETTTYHFGEDEGALLGYAFLRYCEEAGLPFVLGQMNIGASSAVLSAERIACYSSGWAVVTMLRTGETALAEPLFGRESLASMDVAHVDSLVEHFIEVLRRSEVEVTEGTRLRSMNIGVRIGCAVPEILSRLCSKCSDRCSDLIFRLLMDLYDSKVPGNYDGVDNLTSRLLDSWSQRRRCEKLKEVLAFPIFPHSHPRLQHLYPEPFSFMLLKPKAVRIYKVEPIDESTVKHLLDKATSSDSEERFRACLRLFRLYDWGLLNEEQASAFGRSLWAQVGPWGFPVVKHFPFHFFLILPSPIDANAVQLFRQYIANASFSSIDELSPPGGSGVQTAKPPIVITNGNIPLCSDIMAGTMREKSDGRVDWSSEEAIALLDKLIGWWDAGKSHLLDPDLSSLFSDIPGEFRSRYRNLVLILSDVIAPRLTIQTDTTVKTTLKRLLTELDEYGLPSLMARIACIQLYPSEKDIVIEAINRAFTMTDPSILLDAFEATKTLLGITSVVHDTDGNNLLSNVGQQLKWRREASLNNALLFMRIIIEKMPARLSGDALKDVLTGLDLLRVETDVRTHERLGNVAVSLSHRMKAAALAYEIYLYFIKKGQEVPLPILQWREICSASSEFAEVRNQWEPLFDSEPD